MELPSRSTTSSFWVEYVGLYSTLCVLGKRLRGAVSVGGSSVRVLELSALSEARSSRSRSASRHHI